MVCETVLCRENSAADLANKSCGALKKGQITNLTKEFGKVTYNFMLCFIYEFL
jgi:hypothetical protein